MRDMPKMAGSQPETVNKAVYFASSEPCQSMTALVNIYGIVHWASVHLAHIDSTFEMLRFESWAKRTGLAA